LLHPPSLLILSLLFLVASIHIFPLPSSLFLSLTIFPLAALPFALRACNDSIIFPSFDNSSDLDAMEWFLSLPSTLPPSSLPPSSLPPSSFLSSSLLPPPFPYHNPSSKQPSCSLNRRKIDKKKLLKPFPPSFFFSFLFLLLCFSLTSNVGTCYNATYTLFITDFASSSEINLSGQASTLTPSGGGPLKLTEGTSATISPGWAFTKNMLSFPSDTFSTFFEFRISQNQGIADPSPDGKNQTGGDGLTFMLQRVASPLGLSDFSAATDRALVGYHQLSQSFGVEIDTFYHSGFDDDGNHIGINGVSDVASLQELPVEEYLNNGESWYVWVDLPQNDEIEVRISQTKIRPSTANMTQTYSVVGSLGQDDAYFGFGSSVTQSGSLHEILDWRLRTSYDPIIVACPTGEIVNGSSCDPCPAGFSSDESSPFCCFSCPAGTFSSLGTPCEPCENGTYSLPESESCQRFFSFLLVLSAI